MALNPAVLSDRSKLVVYSTTPPTPQGDTDRAQFLFDSLDEGRADVRRRDRHRRRRCAVLGDGRGVRPPHRRGARANAESAGAFDQGQQVALAAIQSRFADYSGVNIEQEMAMLVQLQTAYGANARIMTAVRDMLDMLMRI